MRGTFMSQMQEMFWDTYDRYYHSCGVPPTHMLANVNFKRELFREMQEWYSQWEWHQDPMPHFRIEFHGVKIDCVIDSLRPTLACKAPCESGFDL